MVRLADIGVSRKVLAILVASLLTTIAVGAFGLVKLAEVNANSAQIRDNWLPSTRFLGDLNNYMSDYRTAEAGGLLADSPDQLADARVGLATVARQVENSRAAYAVIAQTDEEAMLYRAFIERWERYRTMSEQTLAYVVGGQRELAVSWFKTQSGPVFEEASRRLGALTDYNVGGGVAASQEVSAAYRSGWQLLVGAILAESAFGAVAIAFMRRQVSKPILDLAAIMSDLARRNTAISVPHIDRGDEIGHMARAVEVFRQDAVALVESRRLIGEQAGSLRTALDNERRAATLQRDFVAMASHEFRTPLTVIEGHARRLMKSSGTVEPPELENRLRKIRGAADRIAELIGQFLDPARFGDVPTAPLPAPLDLPELIGELCARLAEDRPEIELTVSGLESLPVILADRSLIRQALLNLIENAVKYSGPRGPVRIVGLVEKDMAVVRIADHGIGIPAKDMERLFTRYHRASNVGTIPGTGVGLFLVATIARLHGGRVTVDSSEGRGSAFALHLPIGAAA